MKRLILFILAVLLATSSEAQETLDFSSSSNHFTFKHPLNWRVTNETEDLLELAAEDNNLISLTISRFQVDQENVISSHEELIKAVGGLYEELGIVRHTDSISYNDNHTISFEDEYSNKLSAGGTIYHYLKGIICRPVSDGQVMYLIMAEAPVEFIAAYETDIRMIAESFTITEETNPKVYPQSSGLSYLAIFVVLALVTLFFARNRKIQRSKNPLGADTSHYWRCPACRLVNHIDHSLCQRCGAERIVSGGPGR